MAQWNGGRFERDVGNRDLKGRGLAIMPFSLW